MTGLSQRELRQGLTLLQAVSQAGADAQAFARAAVAALPALVASEITTLSVCDLRTGQRSVMGSPGSRLSEQDQACFDRHFGEHPLVRFHAYQRGQGVRRISDSLPFSRFRNSALYCDYYRRIGIDHVVALPILVDDDRLVSFVFNRSRRDFSDRECATLELVRAPLAQMYRQAVATERAQAALAGWQSLQEQAGNAWMQLGSRRELLAASAQALAWVVEHTGVAPRLGQPLPTALDACITRAWQPARHSLTPATPAMPAMAATPAMPATPAAPAMPTDIVWAGTGKRLRLQALWPAGAGQTAEPGLLILLERLPSPRPSLHLDALPLTAREREVMHWLAGGKTDREIAQLLGCSHRTVQKHLERTYQKLGVETRTAAVMRALESSWH